MDCKVPLAIHTFRASCIIVLILLGIVWYTGNPYVPRELHLDTVR